MSGDNVVVEGLDKLKHGLERLFEELPVDTKKSNFEAAMVVAKAAGPLVPVGQTGKLARSIRARSTTTAAVVSAGSPSVPYAAPIHWGWPSHNIAPQPFLYEALDSRTREILAVYDERVAALVDRCF